MTVGHIGEEISAIEKWPPSVRAQHAQVVAALEAKLRAAAAHLDDARDDILAFTARGLAAGVEQQSPGNDVFAGSLASEIGLYLGRPASSVAKLIDEWLYATITGGLGSGEPEYPEMGGRGE
jgi:hypothetical protein